MIKNNKNKNNWKLHKEEVQMTVMKEIKDSDHLNNNNNNNNENKNINKQKQQ